MIPIIFVRENQTDEVLSNELAAEGEWITPPLGFSVVALINKTSNIVCVCRPELSGRPDNDGPEDDDL